MRIKQFFAAVCLACCLVLCGCAGENERSAPQVTGNFEITVLKVGKADAMVLKTENHAVIIDCGEKGDGAEVAEYFAENNISKADYIFITHFDKDHVGGFPEVIKSISAENIITPDYEGNNDEYKDYVAAADSGGLTPTLLCEDISFTLDDVLFKVSVPKKKSYGESDNDFSLVISAVHGENTFLFAGDAEEERSAEILSEFGHKYDFLKIPHHGRYNEYTKKLADTLKPTYAVICDSKKKPAEEKTTDAFLSVGSEIYCTRNGSVKVLSDGKEIKIIQ